MKIEQLKSYLPDILVNELPGEKSHLNMMPSDRKRLKAPLKKECYLGAVMVLIYPVNDVLNIVLMLRPKYEGIHSNQVSLPGGKKEFTDADLSITALRETEEEMGVPKDDIQLLGALTKVYIPPSNFMVYPYVGYLNYRPIFIPEKREVETIIETPINKLFDESIVKSTEIILADGLKKETPYFDIDNHIVWGATALILEEFKQTLKLVKSRL